MRKKAKIYIAAPYTKGEPVRNVSKAIDEAEYIWRMGGIPFIPHLFHFWHFKHYHDYDVWIEMCLNWVGTCDALYRVGGESHGATLEVKYALDRGIPVFRDLRPLRTFIREWEEAHGNTDE